MNHPDQSQGSEEKKSGVERLHELASKNQRSHWLEKAQQRELESLRSEAEGMRSNWYKCVEGHKAKDNEIKQKDEVIERLKRACNDMQANRNERDEEIKQLKIEASKWAFECDRAKQDRDKADTGKRTLRPNRFYNLNPKD
jgi:hypothetical protein